MGKRNQKELLEQDLNSTFRVSSKRKGSREREGTRKT
jgi:hypothetical protein